MILILNKDRKALHRSTILTSKSLQSLRLVTVQVCIDLLVQKTVKYLTLNRVVSQVVKLANLAETPLVKNQLMVDKLQIVIGVLNLTTKMISNQLVTHLNHIGTKLKKLWMYFIAFMRNGHKLK